MIRIQTQDFDAGAEINALRLASAGVGAGACFIGQMRDINDGSHVTTLTLEHYPGMTEKSLEAIVEQAKVRWQIADALVIHRIGAFEPTDQIVLVAVASQHRGEAFAACEFIMDYLKTSAPFWKKETTPQGSHWVDARASDEEAKARWEKQL